MGEGENKHAGPEGNWMGDERKIVFCLRQGSPGRGGGKNDLHIHM